MLLSRRRPNTPLLKCIKLLLPVEVLSILCAIFLPAWFLTATNSKDSSKTTANKRGKNYFSDTLKINSQLVDGRVVRNSTPLEFQPDAKLFSNNKP